MAATGPSWRRTVRELEGRNLAATSASHARSRLVESLLRKRWSPEQISGRLRREARLSISHETIYLHIWNDKESGGQLYTSLRCALKKRRKRHNSYDSRGRLAGKRHISERPAWIEKRRSIGHWEVDTVVGGGAKDCVATLVERRPLPGWPGFVVPS